MLRATCALPGHRNVPDGVGIIRNSFERASTCSDAQPAQLSWAIGLATPSSHYTGSDVNHSSGTDINYLVIKSHLALAL